MSVVATYTVEVPSYQAIIERAPGMRLALEGMVARCPETVSITFWAGGDDFETFETALERAEAVLDVRALSEQVEGRKLYQLHLPAAKTTYWGWARLGGVLFAGTGTRDGLTYRMCFPDREALIAFRKHCEKRGIPFSLDGLHSDVEPPESADCGLTSFQRELLVAAFENGYFEVPRGTTMADLADRFDISDQAASERLRRGLSNLLDDGRFDLA